MLGDATLIEYSVKLVKLLYNDLKIHDITVSLALSTSSQDYTNTTIKNRQYLDVYIRAFGVDKLSRIARVYPGIGMGVLIYSNSSYFVEYQLKYTSGSGTLTYQVNAIQGWTPETYSIVHIFYQTI